MAQRVLGNQMTYSWIRVSTGITILGAIDELFGIGNGLPIGIHAKNGCLGGDINFRRERVVGLAKVDDAASLGPCVPGVIWVIDSGTRPRIDNDTLYTIYSRILS